MWEITTKETAQLYTIQIKDEQDQIAPQICRREKINWKTVLTPIKWLKGKFSRVETSTYHSDVLNKDMENINLYLYDDEWEYKLSTWRTNLARSLLNSLAGEKELGELTISVYAKEKDWKLRPRISVYNDWQKTNWKMTVEAQKVLIEAITKKDWTFVSNDYTELDKVLKNEIEEINKKTKYKAEVKKEEPQEDLPF